MPHKGASTQCLNQQVLAKPCHQPSDRDQQAREKLKQKANIKSQVYIQLGEEALQIVHKTFTPEVPVILHLPALLDNTIDSNTPPTLYVIQEGINCMPTMDYFFTSIKPAPIVVTHPVQRFFYSQFGGVVVVLCGLLFLLQLCQRFLLLWLCSNVLQLLGNVVRVYPRIVQGLTFLLV